MTFFIGREKLSSLVCGCMMVASLTSSSYAASDAELKDAFDAGLNSALAVMRYEKSLMGKKVKKGFCLNVSTSRDGKIDSFNAIKLESLALHMGVPSPMYLREKKIDGQTRDILCFSLVSGQKEKAESLLRKVRENYPKIDDYNPNLILIESPELFTHAVPGIGELHPDSSTTVMQLTSEINSLKGQVEQAKKALSEERERIQKAMRVISGDGAGVASPKPSLEKHRTEGRRKHPKQAASHHRVKAKAKKVEAKAKKVNRQAKAKAGKGYKIVNPEIAGGHRVFIKIPVSKK